MLATRSPQLAACDGFRAGEAGALSSAALEGRVIFQGEDRNMAERIAGISRRNFLTGAGIAAAGAAAWGLTGCAPKAKSEIAATEGASATATTGTAGFDGTGVLSWLEAEPEIAESAVGETLQADVIIVGLGATGPAAARAAAEAGAKVLCFEKSFFNTNSL